MPLFRSSPAWLVAAGLAFIGISSGASAADMPVKTLGKAPIVGASVPLDVHGNLDITVATNRVTGGGLLLYPSGTTLTQINGRAWRSTSTRIQRDLSTASPYTAVSGMSFGLGAGPPGRRAWQEMDAYAGVSVTFAQYWRFSAEYVQFNFPNSVPTAYNSVYTLGYNDAHWGWWFPLNPYVSVFYNMDGDGSTVVFGKRGDTDSRHAGHQSRPSRCSRSHAVPSDSRVPDLRDARP